MYINPSEQWNLFPLQTIHFVPDWVGKLHIILTSVLRVLDSVPFGLTVVLVAQRGLAMVFRLYAGQKIEAIFNNVPCHLSPIFPDNSYRSLE